MKVNIVTMTLRSDDNISQWSIPFSNIKEAKKYANKLEKYWKSRTKFQVKVTVHNLMQVRDKVGKDWRKCS